MTSSVQQGDTVPVIQEAAALSTLTLASVLHAAGLDSNDVLLLRHPLSHPPARTAYETGHFLAYVSGQLPTFPAQQRYWFNFVGEEGTSARFVACYENRGHLGEGQFDLLESDLMSDLAGRLVIDWGTGTRSWWQRGAMAARKPVVSILERQVRPFPGFERLVLSFSELEEVVNQPRRYIAWRTSMRAVNAIYLIVNNLTGKQYVGSAQGESGLLGRWTDYVLTFHGGDKKLVAEIEADPSSFKNFQFSVLQILPRTVTPEEVLAVESLYKRKLLSIPFGLNAN